MKEGEKGRRRGGVDRGAGKGKGFFTFQENLKLRLRFPPRQRAGKMTAACASEATCEGLRSAYPSPDVRSQRSQGELVQHAQRNENHLRVAEHRVNAKSGRLARSRHKAQTERQVRRPPSARPFTLTEHIDASTRRLVLHGVTVGGGEKNASIIWRTGELLPMQSSTCGQSVQLMAVRGSHYNTLVSGLIRSNFLVHLDQ